MPDLSDAYALKSPEEVRALYRAWSASYDAGFGEAQGYQLPRKVAAAFVGAGGQGPVLDVGAGTGLVGGCLRRLNVAEVDAIDLSDDMLAVAKEKQLYRALYPRDVTVPLELPDRDYRGVVSAGTFTLGHVGPGALENLLEVALPGALFVISVNARHYEGAGFADALAGMSDRISTPKLRDVRIFDDRADTAHRTDMARLVVFRRL